MTAPARRGAVAAKKGEDAVAAADGLLWAVDHSPGAPLSGTRAPITADHEMVETPMLLSEKGAAITLLN